MPGAKELMKYAIDNFKTVKILSSIGTYNTTQIKKEKHAWVKKYFGRYDLDVILVPKSSDKAKYASPNSILLDDRDKSINPFKSAGGNTIKIKTAIQGKKDLSKYI